MIADSPALEKDIQVGERGTGEMVWLGILVSSIFCFPYHIPITHLIDFIH